jgi:hypothetical protein
VNGLLTDISAIAEPWRKETMLARASNGIDEDGFK